MFNSIQIGISSGSSCSSSDVGRGSNGSSNNSTSDVGRSRCCSSGISSNSK